MRTVARLHRENPVEKGFLPDKSASVTSRGIGYSGKYSRKSWFIAQLLEKALRIGLSRQRQPPRWFSLSRPREEKKRENRSRSYLDKRKESAEWWTTSRTFLEIRFGGYERVALLRPRLPSWSRNAIPVYSFKRTRDYGNAYYGFMPLEHVRLRKLRVVDDCNWRV